MLHGHLVYFVVVLVSFCGGKKNLATLDGRERVFKSKERQKRGGMGAGLPDGTFSCPKFPFWVNFEGPWNGISYGHSEYFTATWYILWPFGHF
jgi:hypothetical protein